MSEKILSRDGARDISSRNPIQFKDSERAEIYASLFNNSVAGVAISRLADGRFVEVNEEYARMFGYRRDEIIGKTSFELNLFFDQQDRAGIVSALNEKGSFANRSLRMLSKSGQPVEVVFAAGITSVGGQACIVSSVMDVSRIISAEQDAKQRQALLESILSSAGEGIYGLDLEGKCTFANPLACQLLGYSSDELLGKPAHDQIHHSRKDGRSYPRGECPIYAAITDGEVHRVKDEVFWRKDGTALPVSYTSTPLMDAAGNRVGAIVTFSDITQEIAVQNQIQTQLYRLQTLREIDLVVLNSHDLEFTLSNLLSQIQKSLRTDAAAILLLDPVSKCLNFAAGDGFLGDEIKNSSLRLGVGLAGQAALEKKMLHISDLKTNRNEFTRISLIESEGFVSYYNAPLVANGIVKGVVEVYFRSQFDADKEWLSFLQTLAGQTAIAIESLTLFSNLERANNDLLLSYDQVIVGWSKAMDLRDHDTEGHTQRAADLTMSFARLLGFDEDEVIQIWRGALLHDIGKIGVPDSILLKPGKLTDTEMEIMKGHAKLGYEMLRDVSFLNKAIEVVYCHHEKWDGTGYPRGLKGEAIPMSARIFAIVDVYDALTSDRPYRKAWSKKKTLDHIRDLSGNHFDPQVLEVLLRELQNSKS